MTTSSPTHGPVAEGEVIQVAWVSHDIAALEAFLSASFGVPSWMRMPDIHFDPDHATLRGAPADFTAHISLGYAGDLQLELIQPVRGESIYSEFLAAHGPGLHHVCFEVDDMAAALRRAADQGLEVLMGGEMAGGFIEFAYLDGSAAGAPYIELARLSPDAKAFYESLKEQS